MNNNLNITRLQKWENFGVFLFAFAVLIGPAMTIMDSFDYKSLSPDIQTYLGLANGDFDQSPVRRYRFIVPFIASAVNFILNPILSHLKPWTFAGNDFSLGFSFLFVNTSLLSLSALIIYKYLKEFKLSILSIVVALLSFLTCRWSAYIAGLPWVDSLLMLCICSLVFGLKTNNKKYIYLAIIIGPISKESFLLFFPIYFFYSSDSWITKLKWISISLVLMMVSRFVIDSVYAFDMMHSFNQDLDHYQQIGMSLRRMFSFHGIYELFSVVGIWSLLYMGLSISSIIEKFKTQLPKYTWLFVIIVLIHAMLSSDLTRMYYLVMPIYVLGIGIMMDSIIEKMSDSLTN